MFANPNDLMSYFSLFISAVLLLTMYPMLSCEYVASVNLLLSKIHTARSFVSAPRSDIPLGGVRSQWLLHKNIFCEAVFFGIYCDHMFASILDYLSYLLDVKNILQGRHAMCFISATLL